MCCNVYKDVCVCFVWNTHFIYPSIQFDCLFGSSISISLWHFAKIAYWKQHDCFEEHKRKNAHTHTSLLTSIVGNIFAVSLHLTFNKIDRQFVCAYAFFFLLLLSAFTYAYVFDLLDIFDEKNLKNSLSPCEWATISCKHFTRSTWYIYIYNIYTSIYLCDNEFK